MDYPITLSFKTFALAPQITVMDANGNVISYVRQKMLKLKEQVEVFYDTQRTQLYCNIAANKIIDFSATYNFTSPDGEHWGCIRRKGMKSIFRASYEIVTNTDEVYTLTEDSVMVRFLDSIFEAIPLVGLFSGFVFHPSYTITSPAGVACYQVKKQSHFFEGKFVIEKVAEDPNDALVYLSVLMMTLLERSRG